MQLNLTWGELARACGGQLTRGAPDDRADSISTDTRRLGPDQIFWALQGNRLDAHDYLASASDAAGWVVARGRSLPEPKPAHIVEVPDTLKALHALAAFHRKRFEIPVAAITGSNGKTSTKEMLRSICARQGPVCATEGNLNNHVGLPLSMLEMTSSHRYGVFELGASKAGEILMLAQIAQPTVGVLTNIGPAHLEFFGSIEGVFKAKSELIEALPKHAPIAINLDDPWLASLETHLGSRAVTYGVSMRAAVRWHAEEDGSLTLLIQRHRVHIALPIQGRIHYANAAAAAAAAIAMGLKFSDIAEGLKAYKPAAMRFELKRHASGAWIVLDAYNANPGSMKGGIESFCEAYPKAKRILALGDMKELGPESRKFHHELGEWIAKLNIEAVFLAGEDMKEAAEAIQKSKSGTQIHYDPDYRSWTSQLRSQLGKDTALYIKASRAMQFENLIEKL